MSRNVVAFFLICASGFFFASAAMADKDNKCARAVANCAQHNASCTPPDTCMFNVNIQFCNCDR